MMTVSCVLVTANVPYTVEYVDRLRAMCLRHLSGPARFVCFTDRPGEMPAGVDAVTVTPFAGLPGWWSKLHVFRSDVGLSGRVLYLDLDTLVVDSLDPIVDFPAPFATIPDGGSSFQPKNGLKVIKRFNSSVMTFEAGAFDRLYRDWTPVIAKRLFGDQDWLAERLPDAAQLPIEWFPRLSAIGAAGVVPGGARVVLSKKPKNIVAADRWPWFNAIWRAA
jgi:hypothetical protein